MRVCFVLLPDSKPLAPEAFEKALKEFPELGAVKWRSSKPAGTAAFSVAGLKVRSALMPVPVPDGEAEGATERSLSGLDGSWTLPDHRAHLVIAQEKAKDGDLEELTAFTRVVAGVVRASNAVGVYWGEGGATHHPEFVVNIAHSELPLPLWVGISVASAGKTKELLSLGMAQLGLPDLLLTTHAVDGPVLEFFYDLLAYVVRRGKPLPEGDSVGRTEKEKLKVRYVPSPLDPKLTVWSVTLPAPKAKKPLKKKPVVKKKKKR